MTTNKLENVLSRHIGLVSPLFELEVLPGGKISGSVISDTFVGMTDSERQKVIWDALENEWGAEATRKVGTILAYTSAEWNVSLTDN